MTSARNLLNDLLRSAPMAEHLAVAQARLDLILSRIDPEPLGIDCPILPDALSRTDEAGLDFIRSLGPIWLAGMTRAAGTTDPLQNQLYQIYLEALRASDFLERRAPHFYLAHPLPSQALEFGISLLTLRAYPRQYLPEIVGTTLAYLHERSALAPSTAQKVTDLAHAATLEIDRIQKGYALYRRQRAALLHREPPPIKNRREVFALLIQKKMRAAQGYHRNVHLEGQSLDDWFQSHQDDPWALLKAMEGGPHIDSRCPHQSRLIQAMAFGGPMFGVFETEEMDAALQWIEDPEALTQREAPSAPSPKGIAPPASQIHSASKPCPNQGLRKLYTRLLEAENGSEIDAEAGDWIRSILNRTRFLQGLRIFPKPFSYSTDALDAFLERRHHDQILPPKTKTPNKPLTRENWRWLLTQLAPGVLVDGAWLSGVPTFPGRVEPWHLELIRIHDDELGQGDLKQNHPRIYRELLESLDVTLPAIDDPAFSESAQIHRSAFGFPTYLLAMGWCYREFEPECLGLNLAIELSGLGSAYQRTIASLKDCGINPLIAELHLSIDNLASGHTHRARNAIALYLASILQNEGLAAQEKAWQRIYRGYLSYRVALVSLVSMMALTLHLKFWLRCIPFGKTSKA